VSVVISVRIPRELKEKLDRLGINVSKVIREMLEKYVENVEEEILIEKLEDLRKRLAGRIDPVTVAKLVREDRGRS
jgi:predicted DNA-binding protein